MNKTCFRIVIFLATIGMIIFISVPKVDAKGGRGGRGGGSRGGGSRSGGGVRSSIKSSMKLLSSKGGRSRSSGALNSKMALVKLANKGKIKGPTRTRGKGSSLTNNDKIRGPTRTRIKGLVRNNKFNSKMALVRLANTRKTRTNGVSTKKFAKKHWKKAAAFAGGAALVGGTALGYGLINEVSVNKSY